MLLATHRTAPTESRDCNRLFLRKKVKRSTPVLADEQQRRVRFGAVAQAVNARMKNLASIATDQANFNAQKDLPGGKKTMKSYLWMVELNKYDQEHNG